MIPILACVLVLASALALPVSAITLLMLLAGSEGTRHATLLGTLLVVAGPPLTALAGFGLWRRWRWAYVYVLLLLAGIAAWNVARIVRGPTPARTEISAGGVPTHVLASTVNVPLHASVTVLSLGALAALLRRSVRREFAPSQRVRPRTMPRAEIPEPERSPAHEADARGWRVGHRGRDEIYYEERRGGRWERIRIGGEMLVGPTHHVIYFPSPEAWLSYPEWARHRRDEIVGRVQSELRSPEYEYGVDGPVAPMGTAAAPARPSLGRASPSQRLLLALAIVLLLGTFAGTAWLVRSGLAAGETWLPAPRASQRRVVARAEEPATFWLSIGVYATLGMGALGLAAWGAREGLRSRRGHSDGG